MLPSLAAVLRAHDFTVRARRIGTHRDVSLIAAGLARAAELAGDRAHDEPAALLFALSVHGRALGDGWETVPWLLARNHARALGFVLRCDEEEEIELINLRLRVAQKLASFDQVRAWVAAHLHPLR
jgi:hypothetical protein